MSPREIMERYARLRADREARYSRLAIWMRGAQDEIVLRIAEALLLHETSAELVRRRGQIETLYDRLLERYGRDLERLAIRPGYTEGARLTAMLIRELRFQGESPRALNINESAIDALLERSLRRFARVVATSKEHLGDFFRALRADINANRDLWNELRDRALARDFLTDNTPQTAAVRIAGLIHPALSVRSRRRFDAFAEGRVFRLQTRRGPANWRVDAYAMMRARTDGAEAQSRGLEATCLEFGVDLVRISQHATETPICLPHENGIYSITGRSKRYPPLSETPRGGTPFHENCIHVEYPELEEAA